jgi:hypothetical protein
VNLLRGAIVSLCLLLAAGGNAFATATECRAFDEFGDVNCEDLSARLDNFNVALQNEPDTQAIIVFYEGKDGKGRNPRRGEARAKAARMRDYLVTNRGASAGRIVLLDGGYREEFGVKLYICPRGVGQMPLPTKELKAIKFRKGKIAKREYKWTCLE